MQDISKEAISLRTSDRNAQTIDLSDESFAVGGGDPRIAELVNEVRRQGYAPRNERTGIVQGNGERPQL